MKYHEEVRVRDEKITLWITTFELELLAVIARNLGVSYSTALTIAIGRAATLSWEDAKGKVTQSTPQGEEGRPA